MQSQPSEQSRTTAREMLSPRVVRTGRWAVLVEQYRCLKLLLRTCSASGEQVAGY
jgi:hypothetical protein